MRLLKLKVRNIASLKGEHSIDFLEIQRESSLFAITGETGSGKSSILNSIGLALYGQIYKKNVNQIDVVTLGEKEGSIELIFQVKGKCYLADWRAKVRKQNGEPYSTPQTPTRNLYEIEAPDFSAPKNISDKNVTELLNLDFDQYCKCIILNQGEFAKFLTSSFTDRKEILEKLYPGEMLESMTRELRSELDALQKSKEGLEIELQTLQGDGFSGETLKENKNQLEVELKEVSLVFETLEKLEYHFVSLESNHRKFSENENRISHIKEEMALHTTKYNLLLKSGQEIAELKEITQKELETKLPALQILLKKEENLKNLEGNEKQLKQKRDSLILSENKIELELKSTREKVLLEEKKLAEAHALLTLSLDDLKKGRPHFDGAFDAFAQKEVLEEEIKGKKDRLMTLEAQGKDLKAALEETQKKVHPEPEKLKLEEKRIENEKKNLEALREAQNRAEIRTQEIQKSLLELSKELEEQSRREASLKSLIHKTNEELFPLETTLKLQEIMMANLVCVSHAEAANSSECPVCHQGVIPSKWSELKANLSKTDFRGMQIRSQELQLLLAKSGEEERLLKEKNKQLIELKLSREKELTEYAQMLKEKIPRVQDFDQKLSLIQKEIWENDALIKEVAKLTLDLNKTRELYGALKLETTNKEKSLGTIEASLLKLKDYLGDLNKERIQLLKKESRQYLLYLEAETQLEKINQDKNHQEAMKSQIMSDKKKVEDELRDLLKEISNLKDALTKELGTSEAGQLIQELNLKAKSSAEAWTKQEQEQKKQELQLKEFQSRLYELDKLTKDYDLHFTKELHTIKDISSLESLKSREEARNLINRLKTLALNLRSPKELFIPLLDALKTEKEFYKNLVNDVRMKFASVKARLEDWEKLQDKILITKMKSQDITEKFERRSRLFEVLGKDELRTFVLSLVEENLIEQTNQELQKLCQGRYEILHQSRKMKITPEFFILDKFREGHLRKVSTLSGGETFMVSLAMALGLAEMTRGQAEIDSLFIDEGFGTLDQESLEDVLDMLQQIQNRGLMVGIISHIKGLTSSIPVNLVLHKSQDGTSTVSLRRN